jgi:hypothetical protein
MARATIEILQKSSFVTELMVVNDYEASEEVTVSGLAESTAHAPQLSLMSFACADDDDIDYTMHLEMLKSRWQKVPHSRRLHYSQARGTLDQIVRRAGVCVHSIGRDWIFCYWRERERVKK